MENYYILSIYRKTGGPQSLHQLAMSLLKSGKNAFVFYCDDKGNVLEINEPLYEEYCGSIVNNIPDDNKSIIIVPETYVFFLNRYKYAQKVVWWLSLDYYLRKDAYFRAKHTLYLNGLNKYLYPVALLKQMLQKKKENSSVKKQDLKEYYHLYNCVYEKEYLIKIGIDPKRTHYLCGPIDSMIFQNSEKELTEGKRDIVAISTNPKKVNKIFVKKIIQILRKKNINVVEINNLSKEEVFDVFKNAKVYCDFGFFPGPERLPREAVSLYCNIVTSYVGSAQNEYDVLVPNAYKIYPQKDNINKTISVIEKLLNNYSKEIVLYDKYREMVKTQFERFEKDVIEISEICK